MEFHLIREKSLDIGTTIKILIKQNAANLGELNSYSKWRKYEIKMYFNKFVQRTLL